MRYLSVCSGIEAATVAWHPLGWEAAAFSEIEAFPRSVLAHHYPETPCHGDFTTIGAADYGPIDLLVGGTPCQSFSVAGLRKGLADERGNLALEYLRLADRLGARWLVWENVPGVLSSGGGRDFGAFLGGLAQLGYGFAYRVLDAQFFGVPQRRRRVFVVGHLGDWRRAAAVLFERHSLSGHPAPRREKGQDVAGTFTSRAKSGGWSTDVDLAAGNYMQPVPSTGDISHCLNAGGMGRQDYETETLVTAYNLTPSNSNKDFNAREAAYAQALTGSGGRPSARGGDLIAFTAKDHGGDAQEDCSPTLRAGGHSRSHANAGVMPAVAFTGSREIAGALTSNYGKQPDSSDTNLGPTLAVGCDYASPQEAHATSLLRALREQVGEEAFAQWGSGVAYSLQSSEVLRPEVHGAGVRCQADEAGRGLDDGSLPRQARRPDGAVCGLWKAGSERRPPQGRELPEQLARELGEALSKLPHEAASAQAFLLGLRRAGEGLGVLQSALPPAQRGPSCVRRLTPEECEKLQGFPPGYTLVPHRSKPAADGPRYKALGNSMAVPVMAWIGERIAQVEAISVERLAA